MKINIEPIITGISQLSSVPEVTKPQLAALSRIAEIAHHAQSSAYATPTRPSFTYCEGMPSSLYRELTSMHVEKLAALGITFTQHTGMPYHTAKMTFHS